MRSESFVHEPSSDRDFHNTMEIISQPRFESLDSIERSASTKRIGV